ncbi:MAG: hypothetical protein ACHQ51_04980 [Elusimicrobiota bacterium]
MMLLPLTVKAGEKASPSDEHSKSPRQNILRDSVKDEEVGVQQLVDYLQKAGTADTLDDESVNPHLGFPASIPIKVVEVETPRNKTSWEHHECAVVYSINTDNSTPLTKTHPSCFYTYMRKSSGQDAISYWFRISTDGKLEKAVQVTGRNDAKGQPDQSVSAVLTDQSVDSPEVKKAFQEEIFYWKKWLKRQQKAAVKSVSTKEKH